ncbi:ABC transporter substrate-binding protein [Pontibacter fetidus]|uniref:ABC transporter substrate-binding protein n=1 Tax=Pontibacter fetidus TaxID=2700082 RepID=A0A6B2GX59_9BACT|nr:helical backbone metal receptor [Pontibacter fetidus]NDK54563.1 ABC transporter substrate-binding protein [Pontibacter fetidus]
MKNKIIVYSLCLLLFMVATIAGCQQKQEQQQEQGITIIDDLGRELHLPKKPVRVFGFTSAMAEMLFAIGDTANIIARTPDSDYPAAVYTKPIVSNYPVDLEQVLALKPDLIFTSEGMTPLDVAARLEELGIPVYYQKYRTVEDVLRGIEDIGRITGREQVANHLADSLRLQVQQLEAKYKNRPNPLQVLTITWTDPIYVYGQNTLLTDKLRILGAENAVKETFDQPYPALTREYILKLNPDILMGGTKEKLEQTFFSQYPELRKIKAYQTNRIYAPTGNLIERPGPRIVESLKELEGFLYP